MVISDADLFWPPCSPVGYTVLCTVPYRCTEPVFRINLSTAIVAMVGVERRGGTRAVNVSDVCPERGISDSDDRSDGDDRVLIGEFDWDKKQQGLLLGSYYWSYTAAQIPAAWLAKR